MLTICYCLKEKFEFLRAGMQGNLSLPTTPIYLSKRNVIFHFILNILAMYVFCVYVYMCVFLKIIYLFIYLFLAVLGLRFCARAFSSCGKRGPLFFFFSTHTHYFIFTRDK